MISGAFLLPSTRSRFMFSLQPAPIIIKINEPPEDPTGIVGVLIGALGLTGVLTLIALVAGLLMAGVLFWMRSHSSARSLNPPDPTYS